MRPLIDSDVFFSAMLKGHPSHARSRRWLDRAKPAGWAIAAETYLAAVRLLMNPAVMGSGSFSSDDALAAVELELDGPNPGEVVLAPRRPSRTLLGRAAGHRQVMDAWLVQIARDTGRKLATHDKALLAKWPEDTVRVG